MRNISSVRKNSPVRVLIVEDEPLIRWSLCEMLAERGCRVTEAGDGRMALAAIEKAAEPFDVVLLDYRLPDSADLRLLERVRHVAPATRVIMLTAHNSPEVTMCATALGAYRVVGKPFEVETLAALVSEARGLTAANENSEI